MNVIYIRRVTDQIELNKPENCNISREYTSGLSAIFNC